MGPIFDNLKTKYEGKSIRFVRFDLTNATTTGKAQEQARGLNLGRLLGRGTVTGVMELVDNKTGDIIRRFEPDSDLTTIAGALDKYLAGR